MKIIQRMTLRTLCLGMLAAGSLFPLAHQAAASRPTIPVSLYPAGTSISVFPAVTNQDMDCDLGPAAGCTGFASRVAPALHKQTQAELHRKGGWAQIGFWQQGATLITFAVYSSRYTNAVSSAQAIQDLTTSTPRFSATKPAHLRFHSAGSVVIQRSFVTQGTRYYLLAGQAGNREIESLVMVTGRQAGEYQTVVLADLTGQVQAAVTRAGM